VLAGKRGGCTVLWLEANKLASGPGLARNAAKEGTLGRDQRPADVTRVALSTASVFPERTADAFELAARIGYDGIEVMVTADPVSQDAEILRRLTEYHGIPVLAVHSPCLLITQRVWGREPWAKLGKSVELAEKLGAGVVVVHPPFRWQRDYAREFEAGLARLQSRTQVKFAVENIYPLRARGTEIAGFAPHWNPVELNVQHATLDLSHTAVSDSDALEMADRLGQRLAHVHLTDGTKPGLPDEHLVPGRGNQPSAEVLRKLPGMNFSGVVVVEISTRRALTAQERYADLEESLSFARQHLGAGSPLQQTSATSVHEGQGIALCLKNEGHRTVIDQRDGHVRTEYAGADGGTE
jgi:sugar phosphate isomerase/epimerase